MKEKDPLDEVLAYVGSILQVIEKQKLQDLKGEPAPELVEQMEQLKKMMEILNETTANVTANTGKSSTEIDLITRHPPEHLDQKTKQFLTQAKKLKEQIQSIRTDFTEQEQKLVSKEPKKPGEQTASKTNKKKMSKHMGHKGWKKL